MLFDEPPMGPVKDDWLHIQKINDLLFDATQFPAKAQQAVAMALDVFQYSQAALFIVNQSGDRPNDTYWIQCNIPLHIQNQFDDPFSQLNQIAQGILQGGVIYPAVPYLELAAAFPVSFEGKTHGGLFVFGPEIRQEEIGRWKYFLHAIARGAAGWKKIHWQTEIEDQIEILNKLLAAQQENYQDINSIQRMTLEHVRDYYQAEDVILVLYGIENPNLILQKQLGSGEEWIERRSIIPEDSQLYNLRQSPTCNEDDMCASSELVDWIIKSTDLVVNDAKCTTVGTNNCVYGAILIINPKVTDQSFLSRQLVKLMTTITANSMDTSNQITSLKLFVADLEASRWEIFNSRNTLRTFFDSIPASVYIIDKYYTLISINTRRSNRVNKRPNVMVGRKCFEQLFNRNDPCPACRAAEVFNNSQVASREKREWLDQEKYIDWEITAFPIQEMNNLPHQVIMFEEDVTEKRNLETDLIQSEKLAAVGQMAAGVAHEINNPLAAIIANAQILKRELPRDNTDVQASLSLIETASTRASQVISNLLGIARKEKKYEFDYVSLNETIKSALSLVNHEIVNKSIVVNLDLDETIPEILASRNHLQGVWINLIVNGMDAINHTHGQISIVSRYANSEFRVSFEDNGRGIPEDHLIKIFEPFFTTKNIGRGTGLGLSVSMRVIKEHQGTIQVESQVGKGTKFTVILPDPTRKGSGANPSP